MTGGRNERWRWSATSLYAPSRTIQVLDLSPEAKEAREAALKRLVATGRKPVSFGFGRVLDEKPRGPKPRVRPKVRG